LKGSGKLYLASDSHQKHPGNPQEHLLFSNSTFHVPVNDAHQVEEHFIFRQMEFGFQSDNLIRFLYDDWFMPHTAAKLKFPVYWDEECLKTSAKDEL
ncbi:Auxin-binding protein T85, partial [Linum perenne]